MRAGPEMTGDVTVLNVTGNVICTDQEDVSNCLFHDCQ